MDRGRDGSEVFVYVSRIFCPFCRASEAILFFSDLLVPIQKQNLFSFYC